MSTCDLLKSTACFALLAVATLLLQSFALAKPSPDTPGTSGSPGDSNSDEIAWQIQSTGVDASLRGLCVVDAQVVWASGAEGTVLRTTDGGEHWENVRVAAEPELDFRDIHAWDENHALVVAAGSPARFYRTEDGGQSWKRVFEHPDERAFFDAVSFFDDRHGIAMSDPTDGRLLLVETRDAGRTWNVLPEQQRPQVQAGEAGFAGSGTNMRVRGDRVWIALGGALDGQNPDTSRIAVSDDRGVHWRFVIAPIARSPSSGIFSVCPLDDDRVVVIGGDFRQPNRREDTAAVTFDCGATWTEPDAARLPSGYRSCVASGRDATGKIVLLCVGPNGTDYSHDGGRTWARGSETGFHAVQFSPDGRFAWASGSDGRIGRWQRDR